MYYEDICIRGVRAEFDDAVFTLLRVRAAAMNMQWGAKLPARYHSHFYYECHILLEGENKYLIRNDAVTVCAGTMVIIPPYTEHLSFEETGGSREIVLGLILEQKAQQSGAFQYFAHTLQDMVQKPIQLSQSLLNAIVAFYNRFESTQMRDICLRQAEAYGIIVQLFDDVNHFQDSTAIQIKTRSEDSIGVTLELLIDNFDYSLQDIADSLGYSVRHTARLIQKRYGKSLREIRKSDMLTTAKELTAHKPFLSMEKIAEQSGFSSVEAMEQVLLKTENVNQSGCGMGKGAVCGD